MPVMTYYVFSECKTILSSTIVCQTVMSCYYSDVLWYLIRQCSDWAS